METCSQSHKGNLFTEVTMETCSTKKSYKKYVYRGHIGNLFTEVIKEIYSLRSYKKPVQRSYRKPIQRSYRKPIQRSCYHYPLL